MTAEEAGRVRRCLVVDDEPPARSKLRKFLEPYSQIELVGEAGDGAEAVRMIEALRPDLVLLDVQMPEMDGFGVLSSLEISPLPYVIFVTAYDRYAVQAFEVGALDYLQKPVDPDRFQIAVDRALVQMDSAQPPDIAARLERALERLAGTAEYVDRFLVKRGDRSIFLPTAEVEWIEAAGNYLRLHARGGIYRVRGTLREVERRLDARQFVRIHRSRIVNLDRVAYLEPWSHGDQLVVMQSGTTVILSRRYRARLPPMFHG